jgi:(2R)-sulfolactate sulfo-lyase subunit alpha
VSIPQLLVHNTRDNVGVVVVEDVKAGDELLCVVTEDNSDFKIVTKHDVPIGHKIALTDLAEGDTVIKYGEDVGRMVAAAAKGEHVHIHNLKTKRW